MDCAHAKARPGDGPAEMRGRRADRSSVGGVHRSPQKPENMVVKRVVALEGDVVATRAPYPFAVETVPLGHVWVEGEHPEARMSLDSNTYGPVSGGFSFGSSLGKRRGRPAGGGWGGRGGQLGSWGKGEMGRVGSGY